MPWRAPTQLVRASAFIQTRSRNPVRTKAAMKIRVLLSWRIPLAEKMSNRTEISILLHRQISAKIRRVCVEYVCIRATPSPIDREHRVRNQPAPINGTVYCYDWLRRLRWSNVGDYANACVHTRCLKPGEVLISRSVRLARSPFSYLRRCVCVTTRIHNALKLQRVAHNVT